MAGKSRNKGSKASVFDSQQLEKLFAKGDFKRALKEAKVLHRNQPNPQNRRLLERAWVGRAKQLLDSGLREDCATVLDNLDEFGVQDAECKSALAAINAKMGRLSAADTSSGSADPSLLLVAIDTAVLHPNEKNRLPAVLNAEIRIINDALAAVEKGLELGDELRKISRTSPLSDWKLFIRGLDAYHRQDDEAMSANWSRLDKQRPAHKIAEKLSALAKNPIDFIQDPKNQKALAYISGDGEFIQGFQELLTLQRDLRDGELLVAVETLSKSRDRFRRLGVLQDLIPLLYNKCTEEKTTWAIEAFLKAGFRVPIDPQGNRALALVYEDMGFAFATCNFDHWEKYVKDLDKVTLLTDNDRLLAKAILWNRLGRMQSGMANAVGRFPFSPFGGLRVEDLREKSLRAFENAANLAPQFESNWSDWAFVLCSMEQYKQAIQVLRRRVEIAPNDVDSIEELAKLLFKHGDVIEAREQVIRARQLKPLSAELRTLASNIHAASSIRHAADKRWAPAREELELAKKCCPDEWDLIPLQLANAVLERKAKNLDKADELIEDAIKRFKNEPLISLILYVQSRRYRLPKPDERLFRTRWYQSIEKTPDSETVAQLCHYLGQQLLAEQELPDRIKLPASVANLVRDADASEFNASQIHRISMLLRKLSASHRSVLSDFVDDGLTRFPDDPYLNAIAGEMEFDRGELKCDYAIAIKHFEKVVEKLKNSRDVNDVDMVEEARLKLTVLREMRDKRDIKYDIDFDWDAGDVEEFDHADVWEDNAPPVELIQNAVRQICELAGVDFNIVKRKIESGEMEIEELEQIINAADSSKSNSTLWEEF